MLSMLLALGLFSSCSQTSNAPQGGNVGAKPGSEEPKDPTIRDLDNIGGKAENAGAASGDGSESPEGGGKDVAAVSREELIRSLNESSSMWELAQRIFNNAIIYRSKSGQYTSAPIDKELPLCEYDWSNLQRLLKSHREFEYVEDGKVKSIKGIDVSRYQGDINWEKVASDGVRFVFVRLGYRGYETGKLTMDSKFEDNIKGALKNGIAVGVYFVTQAVSEEEGREEAEFVLEAIAPYKVTWPIVLDIEEAGGKARTDGLSASERTDFVIAFCDRVRESGYTPMLYCAVRWFIEELELERLTDCEKWFAQYFNRPYYPYEFHVWQYTNKGSVAGISGNVDLNISMKDYGAD